MYTSWIMHHSRNQVTKLHMNKMNNQNISWSQDALRLSLFNTHNNMQDMYTLVHVQMCIIPTNQVVSNNAIPIFLPNSSFPLFS